jgi:hypothetical protein
MFPIKDSALAKTVKSQVLDTALRDNQHARLLHADGSYRPILTGAGEEPVGRQVPASL